MDEDSTLVMGSDGLWDVLNNEDVYEFIKKVILLIRRKPSANSSSYFSSSFYLLSS